MSKQKKITNKKGELSPISFKREFEKEIYDNFSKVKLHKLKKYSLKEGLKRVTNGDYVGISLVCDSDFVDKYLLKYFKNHFIKLSGKFRKKDNSKLDVLLLLERDYLFKFLVHFNKWNKSLLQKKDLLKTIMFLWLDNELKATDLMEVVNSQGYDLFTKDDRFKYNYYLELRDLFNVDL